MSKTEEVSKIQLGYVRNTGSAKSYLFRGYEPVECSFGKFGTVVGPFVLDHHGEYSHEEPVSVKSAKLALNPNWKKINKFVVTGMADPDAVYTILALSKIISPNLEIAQAIGELDIDPVGINRIAEPYLRVPAFEMQYKIKLNEKGYSDALEIGAVVFDSEPIGKNLEEKAKSYERDRIRNINEHIKDIRNNVLFLEIDGPVRDVAHLKAPIVVQYKPNLNVLTISGLSENAAKKLGMRSVYEIFGTSGLKSIYPELEKIVGEGIGGREEIGGGPRHATISREQSLNVYELIVNLSSKSI